MNSSSSELCMNYVEVHFNSSFEVDNGWFSSVKAHSDHYLAFDALMSSNFQCKSNTSPFLCNSDAWHSNHVIYKMILPEWSPKEVKSKFASIEFIVNEIHVQLQRKISSALQWKNHYLSASSMWNFKGGWSIQQQLIMHRMVSADASSQKEYAPSQSLKYRHNKRLLQHVNVIASSAGFVSQRLTVISLVASHLQMLCFKSWACHPCSTSTVIRVKRKMFLCFYGRWT